MEIWLYSEVLYLTKSKWVRPAGMNPSDGERPFCKRTLMVMLGKKFRGMAGADKETNHLMAEDHTLARSAV